MNRRLIKLGISKENCNNKTLIVHESIRWGIKVGDNVIINSNLIGELESMDDCKDYVDCKIRIFPFYIAWFLNYTIDKMRENKVFGLCRIGNKFFRYEFDEVVTVSKDKVSVIITCDENINE